MKYLCKAVKSRSKIKPWRLTLVALLLLLGARFPVVMLTYQINKDYIADNLCVKKEVKNNCCKGKCWIQSNLMDDVEPEPDKNTPRQVNLKLKLDKCTVETPNTILSQDMLLSMHNYNEQHLFYIQKDWDNSLLKPPQS